MAGIFAALWGLMYAGSSIGAALDNAECKQRKTTFDNAVTYYRDRKGTARLMDGTPILLAADGTVTNCKTGEVIYSKKEHANSLAREKTVKNKFRYAVQNHPRCWEPATVELDTGKVIAKIAALPVDNERIEYRKWYLYDVYREHYGPYDDLTYVLKVHPNDVKADDPGVVITKEEFDAIRNCPTLNSYNFRYHDCYVENESYSIDGGGDGKYNLVNKAIERLQESFPKRKEEEIRRKEEAVKREEIEKYKILEKEMEKKQRQHIEEYKRRNNKNFRKDIYYLETREQIFTLAEREKIKAGCCLYGKIVNRVPFSNKDDAMKFLDKSIPISSVVKNGDILIQEQNVYKETVDENECFISGYVFANCKDYYLDMMDRKSLIMK